MSRDLYPYYERELAFLRQSAREFAEQYPAAAGRLLLEGGQSSDPHVERLLEGSALLAGRVRQKLDDDFPELTDALLGTLYPHYLAPIPSFAVVQFDPDPARIAPPNGAVLPAGTRLLTQPVGGLRLRYRTAAPLTLWPISVREAQWLPPPFPADFRPPARTAAVVRIKFEAGGAAKFGDLNLDTLRLYLAADPQRTPDLSEYLLHHATAVRFRDPDAPADAPDPRPAAECLSAGGFGVDEALLPYPPHALPGYQLLTEFFAMPQKFWFVNLRGFSAARRAAPGRRCEVLIYLDRTAPQLEQSVDATTFRLGCVPVVNLYEQTAEPVALTHAKSEYPVVPNVAHPRGTEVYSVESVAMTGPTAGPPVEFGPFFALHHGRTDGRRTFWAAARRPSLAADDRGTDVVLSLVDSDFRPDQPADGVLVVRTLCTNRDLPEQLRQSGEPARFEPESAAPVTRLRCLHGPTAPLRPFAGRGGYWRLVSHLTLSHLGLGGGDEATAALKGLLALYDFAAGETGDPRSAVARQVVEGVTRVSSRPVVRRTGKLTAAGFCRGLEVNLQLDEEKFIGIGKLLFASVLERFVALHATANTFTQLVVRTRAGGDPLRTWPPRAGELPVL